MNLRSSEQKRQQELTRYSELSGRSKRVKMLEDLRDDYFMRIKSCEENMGVMSGIVSGAQQKEHDWAVHGGIASGIAGGAAGLATAVNIQNKNVEIRKQNQTLNSAFTAFAAQSQKDIYDYKERIKETEEKILNAKIKLVADKTPDEAFELLKVTTQTYEVTKSGACVIQAKVYTTHNQRSALDKFFDGHPAVVDGTIAADIIQDGAKAGTALLTLPLTGLVKDCTLEGIYIGELQKSVPCEIQYRPHKLWIMEE